MFPRQFHECEVTCMQITHRRNQGNMLALMAPLGDLLSEFLFGVNDFHE
jgi:hypothetical protein